MFLYDVITADTGGRMGPATGAILCSADMVLMVIVDTILSLTSVELYLTFVKRLVGAVDRIVFLVNPYSRALLGSPQIAAELEPAHHLGEHPWRLPPVPARRDLCERAGSPNRAAPPGHEAFPHPHDVAELLNLDRSN